MFNNLSQISRCHIDQAMMDTTKLPLTYTWSLELKFMLTNKGKHLDGQFSPVYLEFPQRLEKNILNPIIGKRRGKKRRKLHILTTNSQTAYFSTCTVSLNSAVMFKLLSRCCLLILIVCDKQRNRISLKILSSFYHGW